MIVPVYNRSVPVRHAIQSVLDQDHQNWECIVVDDASTDDTARVCAEMARSDPRIKLFSLGKNRGVSAARNYGLDNISNETDYILFLDSDDQLESNAMSSLSRVIRENDVDMVVFSYNWYDSPFELPYHRVLDRTWIRRYILPQHLNIDPHENGYLQPYIWNKCYRRSLILDHDIRFDEWRKTWEDSAFLIRCLDKCERLLIIPDRLYKLVDYPDIDHLSKRVDPDLFFNYIAGYDKNVEQFGTEYAFHNDYTPRHYFNVIHGLLTAYRGKCDEAVYLDLLRKLLDNETMKSWVDSITPQNLLERKTIFAYQNGDAPTLAQIYRELSEQQAGKKPASVSWKDRVKQTARRLLGDDAVEKIKKRLF